MADLRWSDYTAAWDRQMKTSRVRFYEQTADSKQQKLGAIYCSDRIAYAEDVLSNESVQDSMGTFMAVMNKRTLTLTARHTEMLTRLQVDCMIKKIQGRLGVFLPVWYTGDACTMYQMDNTNIRLTLSIFPFRSQKL